MIEFNINHSVQVRLTERGRAILRAGNIDAPEEDADGWSRWQMWCLMEALGEHVHIGANPPFETTIRLPDVPHQVVEPGASEPSKAERTEGK
jgi:hypothetical protein